MGWLDGWFGASNSGAADSDPLRNLDPKVREFLQKESPVKYTTAADEEKQYQATHPPAPKPQSQAQTSPETKSEPAVPPQSLFPDGRYSHIWKGYKPLSAVEAETKSDHEKLMDVLEGFKERKALIGRAALENCADEQMEWNLCMKEGDWKKRMTLCREEVQKFERCYMVQTRLLKALGYLGGVGRTKEEEERVQMHADRLWGEMVERERRHKEGLEEGSGKVEGVKQQGWTGLGVQGGGEEVPEKMRMEWEEKVKKLPEEDREVEMQALRAEYRAKAEVKGKIDAIWAEQAKEREARKAEGKETVVDKVKGLVGK